MHPLKRNLLPLALLALLPTAAAADYAKDVKDAVNGISEDALYQHLTVLACDRYEGRFTGSFQGKWAGDYIASHFALHGLEPGGTDGFYFPYALEGGFNKGTLTATLEQSNRAGLVIPKAGCGFIAEIALGADFQPLTRSGSGREHYPLVFAGFGVVADSYDSYAKLDAKGTIVVLVDGVPSAEGVDREAWTREHKVQVAATLGVRAVVFLSDDNVAITTPTESAPTAEAAPTWPPPEGTEPLPIPAVSLTPAGAKQLFGPLNAKIAATMKTITKSGKPLTKPLDAELEIAVFPAPEQFGKGRNVIGIWRGNDPALKDEFIVISAHYDHIGKGLFGRVKGNPGEIYNGCDDNASGTSALMEIAAALSGANVKLRRSIMLIAFDSEEIGLIGSERFVYEPTVPLESIIADLNMDMISKGHPTRMYVGGRDSSTVIDQILTRIANRFNLTLDDSGMEQYINRSDQANFLKHKIPAIFLFGGTHSEYHSPDDDYTSPSLHPKKMETIAKLQLLVAVELSERDERP